MRRTGVVLAVSLSLLSAQPLPSSGSGQLFPSTTKILERWSAAWMGTGGHTFTETEAIGIARAFDVVITQPYALRDHLDAMRRANPNVRILAWVNGTWSKAGVYPDDWYARDASGNKIHWTTFDTYLLLPTDAWKQQASDNCSSSAAGYDGCLLDSLGVGAVATTADKTGVPINPATHSEYTRAEWMSAMAGIASYVRNANPSLIITGNGGGRGSLYFASSGATSVLADSLDAVMVEQYVRSPTDRVNAYPSPTEWQKDVEMVIDIQRRNSRALAITKLWVPATNPTLNAWHEFALATFMLATNGTSYFQFIDQRWNASVIDHPWDRDRLGQPTTNYFRTGSIYRRGFKRGVVLVNPSASTITVPLGRPYVTLAGRRMSAITMRAWTGAVLVFG